jgi:hypothetical protein
MFFLGSLDPRCDCVLHILHRLEFGGTVQPGRSGTVATNPPPSSSESGSMMIL